MDARFTCPGCRSTHHWPRYVRGKAVTCPKCRNSFIASEANEQVDEDLPSVLPVSPDEPLDVLAAAPGRLAQPLEETKRQPRPLPEASAVPFSSELKDAIEYCSSPGLSIEQRTLYVLLNRTLDVYTSETGLLILGYSCIPLLVVVGAAIAYLGMAAVYGLLYLSNLTNLAYTLYLLPLLMLMFAREMEALARKKRTVDLSEFKGAVERMTLGRLDDIFNFGAPGNTGFWLGAAFGFQFGLLHFTPNHGFLPIDGGFGQCFLLTLDNLCHGLFLFLFDIFNIHLAGRFDHGTWSGTIFYFFRLAYDALALLLVYQLYQRWRLRRLFRNYYSGDAASLATWIEERVADEFGWPGRFFDEFMFLALAGQYLRGNFDFVRQVSRQFPRLRVTARVRDVFVDLKGQLLFESCLERE